ncbi:uncharacterized protein LOC106874236 [Octopus bimaculoides]|uniref:uncharacterized protein LOC106874236 n=1 Tax=Octopus bimaculoides TaxID=37653 RepID=UPI0022E74191|nr:uncharacterized protein LOC106874236 [Octopus bimaculoides]
MLLPETSKQENDGLIASYNIALLVAKSGKSLTNGETLLHPFIEQVLSTVMHEKPHDIMKKIPLSNNTISRHIDEMAKDVKHQLINILQRSEFSIQLDELTVVDNQCLTMVYVRYFSEGLQLCEEMLFTEKLPLDSKGATIFRTHKSFLSEHNMPLSNILASSTTSLKDELVDEDLTTYRNYLQSLHDNTVERFQDVIALNIPNWYSNPFEVDAVDCEYDVQEELIELQNDNDTIMRYRRNGKENLWYNQRILNSYPNLWKYLKLLLLAFPISYLVESGLNHVGTLLSHKRIRLDMTSRENLRLKLTS